MSTDNDIDFKDFTRILRALGTAFTKKQGEGRATINRQSPPQTPCQSVLISLHLYEGPTRTLPPKLGKVLWWWQRQITHFWLFPDGRQNTCEAQILCATRAVIL